MFTKEWIYHSWLCPPAPFSLFWIYSNEHTLILLQGIKFFKIYTILNVIKVKYIDLAVIWIWVTALPFNGYVTLETLFNFFTAYIHIYKTDNMKLGKLFWGLTTMYLNCLAQYLVFNNVTININSLLGLNHRSPSLRGSTALWKIMMFFPVMIPIHKHKFNRFSASASLHLSLFHQLFVEYPQCAEILLLVNKMKSLLWGILNHMI